jgi:integrase
MHPKALESRAANLFDASDTWREEPLVAFKSLLTSPEYQLTNNSTATLPSGHEMRGNSAKVYELMFGKYVTYLKAESTNFTGATPLHVGSFLTGALETATQETVWRYIRLLERVYQHLVNRGVVKLNPVTAWVQERIASGVSPKVGRTGAVPAMISRADVGRLQDWLFTHGKAELAAGRWRVFRDLTLGSLSLGTGMRCAELLKLSKRQVKYFPGGPAAERFEFDLPASASVETSKAHGTMAEESCVDLFEKYWELRWSGFPAPLKLGKEAKRPLPAGELVFPATLTGASLDTSTLFKNLKRFAAQAVQEGALEESLAWVLSRGAQGLRRAYVLTELEAGSADQLVAYRMGVWHQRSVRKYKEAIARTKPRSA